MVRSGNDRYVTAMVQAVKNLPVSNTPSVSASRPANIGGRHTSSSSASIEELSSGTGVMFDAAAFAHDGTLPNAANDSTQNFQEKAFTGDRLFKAPSTAFASLVEQQQGLDEIIKDDAGKNTNTHEVLFAKNAISIYETTAKVISGTLPTLGQEVSLTL